MKTLSRREVLRLVGIGSAAAALAACQPEVVEVEKIVEKPVEVERVVKETVVVEKEAATPAPVQEVTITHWNGFTGPDRPCLENLVAQFSYFREDIEIDMTIMPWDGVRERLAPAWAGGAGPDFVLVPSVWIPAYGVNDQLLPLDDHIVGPRGLDPAATVPMCMDCHMVAGQTYAVCMGVNNWALYRNLEILEAAGIDPTVPPKTTDDVIEYAQKTQSDDISGFPVPAIGTSFFFSTMLCMGGDWITPDKVCHLDQPAVIEASKYLRGFVDAGLSPENPADVGGLFRAGKSAMFLGGPWMTVGFTAAGLQYEVTEWVEGTQLGTQGGALGYAIGRESKHADQCWEFMRWWQEPVAQIPWCECSSYPPANLLLVDHPRIQGNKNIRPFANQVLYATAPAAGVIQHAEVERLFRTAVEAVMVGMAPEEVWPQAHEDTVAILAKEPA